ncbi:unnamed protein product [Pylaiella littoralis]
MNCSRGLKRERRNMERHERFIGNSGREQEKWTGQQRLLSHIRRTEKAPERAFKARENTACN